MTESDEMDVSLKTVMLSHLSDMEHEINFLDLSADPGNQEYKERMEARMRFLKHLALKFINVKERIYPETELLIAMDDKTK